jgi:hypothetical protein
MGLPSALRLQFALFEALLLFRPWREKPGRGAEVLLARVALAIILGKGLLPFPNLPRLMAYALEPGCLLWIALIV